QQLVLWHRSAIDWGPFGSAARILARLRATRRGEIVLMHDGRNRHNRPAELLRVLPDFLRELHRRGLRAAPLDSDA
ncbi:MAG: polysaccharide deacetylase family protein, partial [Proteobacteria bacterium]